MNISELEAELRRTRAAPVYWVTGEEDYLRDLAVRHLKDAVLGSSPGDQGGTGPQEFNEVVLYGDEADGAEILAAAREAPIFSSRRVVVVKAAEKLSSRETEGLLGYLKDPCDSTTVIFVSHKLDGRQKFTQALKERAVVVDCAPLSDVHLERWIRAEADRLGLRLVDEAVVPLRELAETASGTGLYLVRQELAKLASYVAPGRAVEPADVEMVRGGLPGASVFDLAVAIADLNRARALQILGRNLEAGEAPLRILGSLLWQYRRIWKAKDLLDQGRSEADLVRALAISPYRLRDLRAQARRFPPTHLRYAFDLLLKADSDLKGGSGGDAARVLEGVLLDLCADLQAATRPDLARSKAPAAPPEPSAPRDRKKGTPISNVRTIRSGKSPAR